MCLLCCCPSAKTCTLISAIIVGAEAAMMAIVNLLIILCCTCAIRPYEGNMLKTDYMESMWSWFMLDSEACDDKYDDYKDPKWYEPIPDAYTTVNSYDLVKQHSNYIYQIMFFMLNSLWAIFSAILLCGRITHIHILYIPWLLVGILTTFLDTLVGSFYIAFMAQTDPGFQEGKAIFAMQFLFFRGFVFYLYNLFAIVFVCSNFYSEWRKHRKEKKLEKKIKKKAEHHAKAAATTAAVAATTAAVAASTSKSQPPKNSRHDDQPPKNSRHDDQPHKNSRHDNQPLQNYPYDLQPPRNSQYGSQQALGSHYDNKPPQIPRYDYQPSQSAHYENQPPLNPRYPPLNPRPDYQQNDYQQSSYFGGSQKQQESFVEMRQTKPSVPEKPKASVPQKYQPFSYTNPAFRPSDPNDIEAMKRNSSPVNPMDYENKIPRPKLQ